MSRAILFWLIPTVTGILPEAALQEVYYLTLPFITLWQLDCSLIFTLQTGDVYDPVLFCLIARHPKDLLHVVH